MTFDPKKHIIKIQGNREYLPVAARLIWFRQDHPDWGIITSPVEINMERQYVIFSCSILNAEGKVMATATKMENVRGFPDYLEKAETGSVGRALAYVGYGTQFAPELEEASRFADAPQPARPASGNTQRPQGSGGGRANNYGTAPVMPATPMEGMAANQCCEEGCTVLLKPAQMTMSLAKFGLPFCLAHQKGLREPGSDVASAAGGAAAAAPPAIPVDEPLIDPGDPNYDPNFDPAFRQPSSARNGAYAHAR